MQVLLTKKSVYTNPNKYYEIKNTIVRRFSLTSKGLRIESADMNRTIAIAGIYDKKKQIWPILYHKTYSKFYGITYIPF